MGAAVMGGQEAAVLLLALYAAPSPAEAPEAVATFTKLKWEVWPEAPGEPWRSWFYGRRFARALGRLLDDFPRVVKTVVQEGVRKGRSEAQVLIELVEHPDWLTVTLNQPLPAAAIRVGTTDRLFVGSWSSEPTELEAEHSKFATFSVALYAPLLMRISGTINAEAWKDDPLLSQLQKAERAKAKRG
jgi:hypothetical protein